MRASERCECGPAASMSKDCSYLKCWLSRTEERFEECGLQIPGTPFYDWYLTINATKVKGKMFYEKHIAKSGRAEGGKAVDHAKHPRKLFPGDLFVDDNVSDMRH